MPFETRQKVARGSRVLADDAVDHDLIAISHVPKLPKPLIGLREKCQPFKSFQQQGLEILKFCWLDGISIVVVERHEYIILFHRLPPPGSARRLPDSTRKSGRWHRAKPSRHFRRARTCGAARPCPENGAIELAGPSPPPLSSDERSPSCQTCNIWSSICKRIMVSPTLSQRAGL